MNRGDIETRAQLTAAVLLQPPWAAPAWLNIGDLSGHKRTLERDAAMVLKADKGFHRRIRSFTAQVGEMWEFKLREQSLLNIAILFAAFAPGPALTTFTSAVTAPTGTASFNGVKQGYSYLLTTNLGVGVPTVNLNTVVVQVSAVTKTLGVDYDIDLGSGEIYIIPGGTIADGNNITVTYGNAVFQWDVWAEALQVRGGVMGDAGQKIAPVKLFEFDQHAANGTPRRIHTFNGQYLIEGDDDHDGKKPSELTLKILAIDKPAVAMLK